MANLTTDGAPPVNNGTPIIKLWGERITTPDQLQNKMVFDIFKGMYLFIQREGMQMGVQVTASKALQAHEMSPAEIQELKNNLVDARTFPTAAGIFWRIEAKPNTKDNAVGLIRLKSVTEDPHTSSTKSYSVKCERLMEER
jgi:hypothetical protein